MADKRVTGKKQAGRRGAADLASAGGKAAGKVKGGMNKQELIDVPMRAPEPLQPAGVRRRG